MNRRSFLAGLGAALTAVAAPFRANEAERFPFGAIQWKGRLVALLPAEAEQLGTTWRRFKFNECAWEVIDTPTEQYLRVLHDPRHVNPPVALWRGGLTWMPPLS